MLSGIESLKNTYFQLLDERLNTPFTCYADAKKQNIIDQQAIFAAFEEKLEEIGKTRTDFIRDIRAKDIRIHRSTYYNFRSGIFSSPNYTYFQVMAMYVGVEVWQLIVRGKELLNKP